MVCVVSAVWTDAGKRCVVMYVKWVLWSPMLASVSIQSVCNRILALCITDDAAVAFCLAGAAAVQCAVHALRVVRSGVVCLPHRDAARGAQVNAPSHGLSIPANLLYVYNVLRYEGWSALVPAYTEAMLVTVGKFSIRCTQHSIEEMVSAWFGPFGRLMLPAAAAAVAAGSNALRAMRWADVHHAPWNSFLSVVLWMECGALASCYKQLGHSAINLDQNSQRALRFWGLGGGSSVPGEGRARSWRLPLVRFRSEEARAQWFATAYGSLEAAARQVEEATGRRPASVDGGGAGARVPQEGASAGRDTTAPAGQSVTQHEAAANEEVPWGPSLSSREAARVLRGVERGGLRAIVSKPRKMWYDSKASIESQTETDLARKMWTLRTQHIRSAEFSRNLPLSLTIDPDDVLASTFAFLEPLPAEVLISRPMFVRFKGQIGSDWGGVRRAWMAKLSAELFDPRLGLVIPCSVLATKGTSATGTIAINPAPDLLYTDPSVSQSRTSRETKRDQKRFLLRAQLEVGSRRDRDRERARKRESVATPAPGGSGGAAVNGSGNAVAADTDALADDVASSPPDAAVATDLSGVGEEASEGELDGVRWRPRSRDTAHVSSPSPAPEGAAQASRGSGGWDAHAVAQAADLSIHVAPEEEGLVAGDASEEQTENRQVGSGAGGDEGEGEGDGEGDARLAAAKSSEVDKWRDAEHKSAIKDKNLMDRYLRFMGRMLGVALLSGDTLGVNLDSSFFK